MAKYAGVWGIDIGQAAFKALRCQVVDGQVVADAFDYIEYPKILSQPEAEPEQMIRDALNQFLSRNDLKGNRIAMAVPGQSGLAKFFKPPPVDAKRIPELVKFEAKQQIPFALEDVIWDFQQMGGAEIDGFALETEVGLFAMKREQVYRAMKPFQDAGVELDIIQLAPLGIYNFVSYDVLATGPAPDEYDPDNPPASLVVLSMGTDTTDLVITNGFRVWQRSIPLGGNHFTKQLTKELKLTFAKAEHLKRNARQAEDPKLVFQAMRPVFNDLVTEVQRSIGYFQGIDRKAKIGGVVVLGNAVKLPGLQQYLAKNLGYEVNNFQAFSKLGGSAVLSAPVFRDNQLSFGVCYGLCLQGLDVAKLKTNLVPREIVTDRLVRAKKPWAVASVGALLLACTFNVFFHYGRLREVAEDREVAGVSWKQASQQMDSAQSLSSSYSTEDKQLLAQLTRVNAIGEELVGNTDRRVLWLELIKAVNEALPRTPGVKPGEIPDVEKYPFDTRQEIHVDSVEAQYFEKLDTWFTEAVKKKYVEQEKTVPRAGQTAPPATAGATTASAEPAAPQGEGWVIQLECYHYFNSDRQKQGLAHVLTTLINNLKNGRVVYPVPVNKIMPGVVVRHQDAQGRAVPKRVVAVLPIRAAGPNGSPGAVTQYELTLQDMTQGGKPPTNVPIRVPLDGQVPVVFTMQEMGVDYPVVVQEQPIDPKSQVPNPNYDAPQTGYPGGEGGGYPGGGLGGPPGVMGGSGAPGVMGGAGAPGMMGSGGSMGPAAGGSSGGKDSDEPTEPPFLTVPRYDFTVQFCWTEKLLSARLEEQAKKWEAEKSQQGMQPTGDANLAANLDGGA